MDPNVRGSDLFTLLGGVHAVSQGAGSVSSGWISAADFFNFLIAIDAGVLGASATFDAKIEQATDDQGAGAKDVAGAAVTQLTKAGNDDDKWALINLRQAQLDTNNAFTHFRLTLTVATAASLVSAMIWGLNARQQPAAHVAAVDEVVG